MYPLTKVCMPINNLLYLFLYFRTHLYYLIWLELEIQDFTTSFPIIPTSYSNDYIQLVSDIAITKMGDQPEKNIFVELYSWNHQLSHEAVLETIIILVGLIYNFIFYIGWVFWN